MSILNKVQSTINRTVKVMNQIRPLTNKCAFAANFLLALLLPFALTGKINAKAFDHTMFWLYLVLCIINRPNSSIRKSFFSLKDAMSSGSVPPSLFLRKVYCAGLWFVKFLLRIAMFIIPIYHIFLSPFTYIPVLGEKIAGIYASAILYVFILSNLNLGVSIGRYFSGKLSKSTKIFINVIWFLASVTGFYQFSKAGLWKHLFQLKKLTSATLSCYFLAVLLFAQIGFLYYEFTIGREKEPTT